ncbi:MAG: alpha/beta fold hydrolase [Ramlibacter sp.]|nr:alpha/beta fold hydrolase [Ramlibacter sp.]
MLARIQQFITLTLALLAAGWFTGFVDRPWLAWGGGLLIVTGYAGVLALEFAVSRWVNANDPVPAPSGRQLLRAWVGEVLMAPRVFCWRQPFRAQVVPDLFDPGACTEGACGVVLIHGFFCNRGFWTPWLKALRARGHACVAVNLEPVFGSIDDYVPIIEDAVSRVSQATGRAPVLVCHSMGGLAARAFVRAKPQVPVLHVITIGTPHHGTWLGRFSRASNGRQMRLNSGWLEALARADPEDRRARFTCWYSNCDNIVFPASSAALAGADNRLVPGVAHVDLAFHGEVMSASLAKISAL